jgi:hypothetical protein
MISRFSFKPASISGGRGVTTLAGITIAPNPTHGSAHLTIPNSAGLELRDGSTITLFNTLGQAVLEVPCTAQRSGGWGADIDMATLPAGLYYGRVGAGGAFGPIVLAR